MTIMPSPGFITELRNRSRAEREAAKDLRAHMVKVATWLAEHAPGLDSSQIIGSADELRREAGAIAHAEQLAADYEATAHHMADVLAGQGGQPIEAEARAAVESSQPLPALADNDRGPAHPFSEFIGRRAKFTGTDGALFSGRVLAASNGRVLLHDGLGEVELPVEGIANAETIPDDPGPDRTAPDGPGHARTPVGRIVATQGGIDTDTAPVAGQPKGGAK